jgi:hypothetical protein
MTRILCIRDTLYPGYFVSSKLVPIGCVLFLEELFVTLLLLFNYISRYQFLKNFVLAGRTVYVVSKSL